MIGPRACPCPKCRARREEQRRAQKHESWVDEWMSLEEELEEVEQDIVYDRRFGSKRRRDAISSLEAKQRGLRAKLRQMRNERLEADRRSIEAVRCA